MYQTDSKPFLHKLNEKTHVHADLILVAFYIIFSWNVLGGSERGNIGEIRDLINLEMPQLSEALSPNTTSIQVIDRSYGIVI